MGRSKEFATVKQRWFSYTVGAKYVNNNAFLLVFPASTVVACFKAAATERYDKTATFPAFLL